MAGIRVSDGQTTAEMWAAIGWALQASAGATHEMLQLAATVAGSELVQFPLQDGTLGAQIKAVRAVVDRLNTNPYIEHPRVDESDKLIALRLLRSFEALVRYRNRVAHDVWWSFPDEVVPQAIEGRRATRWSPITVHSTVPTLNTLGYLFTDVAVGLSRVAVTIERKRADKLGPAVLEFDAEEQAVKLEGALASIKAGTLARWRWVEERTDHLPSEEDIRAAALRAIAERMAGSGADT